MPIVKISEDRNTMFEIQDSNHTFILEKGVTIDSATGGIFETMGLSGNRIVVEGKLKGGSTTDGAGMVTFGENTTVEIAENGTASGNWGVFSWGANADIANEGRIRGGDLGVGVAGDGSHFTNRGIIQADTVGFQAETNGSFGLDNDGTIRSSSGLVFAVHDLSLNFGKDSVVEFGAAGFIDIKSEAGWETHLVNKGHITNTELGMSYAIQSGDGAEIIRNTGVIAGDIHLGGGDDRYDGRGGRHIGGPIVGGAGDDIYLLSNRKDDAAEYMGEGRDTLKVSFSYELYAGREIEELYLVGKKDIDLTGNELDNYLQGNKGDNRLTGGTGWDALFGGRGEDILTGGADLDGFYFKPNAGREIVTDFTDGEDLLILFQGNDIESVADLLANHTHQRGDDLVISGDGTEMILRDFDKANLTEADFTV